MLPLGTIPVPVLAFCSTLHLALAALRNHRSAGRFPISSLTLVSVLHSGLPWVLLTPLGVGAGFVAHAVWFAVCERFTRFPTKPVAAQAPAVTPVVSAAAPRPSGPVRPKHFIQVPVLAVLDETPDIRTFRLLRPEGFDFAPGQFLTVRFRADGKEHARCYSISSAPEARGYLEISVKRQGVVSSALHAALRTGALLSVKAPAGAFTYPAGEDRPIVLLAGGVGITPLMSMLRHGVAAEPARPITLVYSAQREDGHAFRDELQTLAGRHPQLRVHYAASRGATQPHCYPGRIDESLLRAAVPDIAHSISLVCGPRPMIDATKALLATLGVPAAQMKSEYFEAAVAASSTLRAERDGRGAGQSVQASPARGGSFEVRFERSGIFARASAGQTLLETAEASGVNVACLCRAGVCGTCRIRVISGDVSCRSDMLDEDERRQGVVLACVTSVNSACTIEA